MDERPCHSELAGLMTREQMDQIFRVLSQSMGHEYAEVTLIVKRGKVRFVQLTTSTEMKSEK